MSTAASPGSNGIPDGPPQGPEFYILETASGQELWWSNHAAHYQMPPPDPRIHGEVVAHRSATTDEMVGFRATLKQHFGDYVREIQAIRAEAEQDVRWMTLGSYALTGGVLMKSYLDTKGLMMDETYIATFVKSLLYCGFIAGAAKAIKSRVLRDATNDIHHIQQHDLPPAYALYHDLGRALSKAFTEE